MTKQIPLGGKHSNNHFALVSDEDYELLNRYKWRLANTGYAACYQTEFKSIYRTTLMHTVINCPPDGMFTDHKDRNKLNNTRENLRCVTRSQNSQNRTASTKNKRYKGVRWIKKLGFWFAAIHINGKLLKLGLFPTQREAAIAYNNAATKHFGEFACLNEIPPDSTDDKPVVRTRPPRGLAPYRGVRLSRSKKRWTARIAINKKEYSLGAFSTPEDAARAYDRAVTKMIGPNGFLNFPNP